MASAVGNRTFSSFFERAWSDHHDVYAFTKAETKSPLIVEARGLAPAESNVFSLDIMNDRRASFEVAYPNEKTR